MSLLAAMPLSWLLYMVAVRTDVCSAIPSSRFKVARLDAERLQEQAHLEIRMFPCAILKHNGLLLLLLSILAMRLPSIPSPDRCQNVRTGPMEIRMFLSTHTMINILPIRPQTKLVTIIVPAQLVPATVRLIMAVCLVAAQAIGLTRKKWVAATSGSALPVR